jgi:hypothetical protein
LSGAAAQQHDDISNPRGVIPNFDVANIGPILTELGAVWQQKKTDGGQPYIAVSVGGDMVLNIVPTACQGANFTHCVGMNTMALFQGGQFNYQTVSAFNQKYWFSTAGVAEDGSAAYISRYEISDYGIARGNVGASVLNLVVLADLFRQELLSSRRTVSMEGYAEDLSSRLLNSRSLKAMGVEDTGQITRHQVAMEETVELVQLLLADKNAPRNKIENITAKP